jgi:hypothetical protein
MIFFGILQFPPPTVHESSEADTIISSQYFRFQLGIEPCMEICYIDDEMMLRYESIPCKDITTIL